MVAQNMAQSYDQLFHPNSQEPQEFISLDQLGPHRVIAHNQHQAQRSRDHQWVSTSSTSSHLYPASTTRNNRNPDENYDDDEDDEDDDDEDAGSRHCRQDEEQRTYYNLSSAGQHDPCGTVYFSELIDERTANVVNESEIKLGRLKREVAASSIVEIHRRSDDQTIENDVDSNRSNATRHVPIVEKMEDESTNDDYQHPRRCNNYQAERRDNKFQHDDSTSVDETASEQHDDFSSAMRKRKISFHDDNDLADATGDEAKSNKQPKADSKKQNHSAVEKRRRDKMNTYITELSAMIPMCHAMSRKLDKLTVLRLAVQHLKTILGAVTSYTDVHYKPTFISDQELKTLILQAAEGFVFVVGCDRGRILYVSQSVAETLNYSQDDLLGQSLFDILHPKDVAKVKEQLSSSDLSPRERLIDAKTMLPVKTDVPQEVSRLCPGARRSFFCRMKRKLDVSGTGSADSGGGGCGSESQEKEEADTTTGCHKRKKRASVDWKYCVIYCAGYLKSWAPAKIGLEEHDGDGCSLSCLVAVGRIQPAGIPSLSSGPTIPRLRPIEFISRHTIDGKFLFVDQRATLVLGFLPQELLGTSMYEYYHHDDIPQLADSHKTVLQSAGSVITRIYRFRAKGTSFVKLQSEWKSFRNPWTKDIEYLISKNSAVFCDRKQVESRVNRSEGSSVKDNYDFFAQSNGGLERLISSHVEMSKIGRRIAEEVLDNQRRNEDSCSVSGSNSIAPDRGSVDVEFQITTTVSPEGSRDVSQAADFGSGKNRTSSTDQTSMYNQQIARNNDIANDQGGQQDDDMLGMIGGTVMNETTNPLPSDGNDEAAMAVIMSLLEADAGLGGPVDFSGLPWPLP